MIKIGVVSDTHSAGSGRDLPGPVLKELAGVDLILHCGDLECLGVLDVLEEVAPVLAVRGYEDPMERGERLAYQHRVVSVEGVKLGMVHDIQWPTTGIETTPDGSGLEFPNGGLDALLEKKFGERVDAVLFGDTHEELICSHGGTLFINPGSPTYPGKKHVPGSLGTLAILEVDRGSIYARLVELERSVKVQ